MYRTERRIRSVIVRISLTSLWFGSPLMLLLHTAEVFLSPLAALSPLSSVMPFHPDVEDYSKLPALPEISHLSQLVHGHGHRNRDSRFCQIISRTLTLAWRPQLSITPKRAQRVIVYLHVGTCTVKSLPCISLHPVFRAYRPGVHRPGCNVEGSTAVQARTYS